VPALADLVKAAIPTGFRAAAATAPTPGSRAVLERLARGDALLDDWGFPAPGEAGRHVLFLPRPGARRLVLALTGTFGHLRLLPDLAARPDCAVVYFVDATSMWHLGAISGFSGGFGETLDGLRRIAERLGGPRLAAIGLSSGGYTALKAGLALGLGHVLAFSAPTTLSGEGVPPWVRAAMNRFPRLLALLPRTPGLGEDMAAAYRAAPLRPRVTLAYAEGYARDRYLAERMKDVPDVRLVPVEGFDKHVIVPELRSRGLLKPLLDTCLA
jgi:hypothetical protein